MTIAGINQYFADTLPRPLYLRLLWLVLFCRYAVVHFFEQRGIQTASSLAYTTLLSLVPLLTVVFGFLGGLPVFKSLSADIQGFIFDNFVPSVGVSVQGYLLDFSAKAAKLTFSGTVVLIIIALMLMATIENTFNRIWNIKTRRSPVSRFLVYWAILTLGPMLIGAGLASTSYLLTLPALNELYPSFGLQAKLLRAMPFVTTSLAFTFLYILIPNCMVPKKNAIIGAIIAAILFEMAKFGFGIYVKAMPGYEAIYGAIAIIPIFLIWIYLSWVIIILGAHMSYCLSNFHLDTEGKQYGHRDWDFIDVYRIIALLWQAQQRGESIGIHHMKKSGLALSQSQMAEILYELQQAKWVSRTSGGRFMLSRDMADTTVSQLHAVLPCRFLSNDEGLPRDKYDKSLNELIERYKQSNHEVLDVSLKALLQKI